MDASRSQCKEGIKRHIQCRNIKKRVGNNKDLLAGYLYLYLSFHLSIYLDMYMHTQNRGNQVPSLLSKHKS